eukprot:Sdes_comp16299_c0_seq1m5656
MSTYMKRLSPAEVFKNNPLLKDSHHRDSLKQSEEVCELGVFSPGVLADSYLPPLVYKPIYTLEGIRMRYLRFKKFIYSTISVVSVRKNTPGFKASEFAVQVTDMYNNVNIALAKGDLEYIKSVCTKDVFQSLSQVVYKRNRTDRYSFSVLEDIERPSIAHVVAFPVNKKTNLFAQITIRIHQKQLILVHNNKGKLIYGKEDSPVEVSDYFVVERSLYSPHSHWKICGKILPEALQNLAKK